IVLFPEEISHSLSPGVAECAYPSADVITLFDELLILGLQGLYLRRVVLFTVGLFPGEILFLSDPSSGLGEAIMNTTSLPSNRIQGVLELGNFRLPLYISLKHVLPILFSRSVAGLHRRRRRLHAKARDVSRL